MERIPLARGRWVRFDRPMYISDRRLMASVADMPEDSSLLDVFDRLLSVIEPVVAERSWDGPFDQLTPDELQDIGRAWRDQSEDDALPLDDATSSETSPQPGT
jgi:hypothetical protein